MHKTVLSFSSLILLGLFTACNSSSVEKEELSENKNFTIVGTVDDNVNMAYLSDRVNGEIEKIDSCKVEEKSFTFSGELTGVKKNYLSFDNSRPMVLFIEGDTLRVDVENVQDNKKVITGSNNQTIYTELIDVLGAIDVDMYAIGDKYQVQKAAGATEEELKMFDPIFDSIYSLKDSVSSTFVKENGNSIVAPYIILSELVFTSELEDLNAYMNGFSAEVKDSKDGKRVAKRIKVLESMATGNVLPDFEQPNREGNPVKVSDFRGKYLLIDFWASWCGPCRGENPNLVAAYVKYKEKGFEILGVSLDDNKEKWEHAIESDSLTWTHVSDLKGWSNTAARQFDVYGIPMNILIDTEGKVVAKDLRGEELEEKLAEIFE